MIIRLAVGRQDIEAAVEVYWAIDQPGDASEKAVVQAHWMRMQTSCPEGFWVAEDEASGQIVGVVSALRRAPQWILANFYVLPAYQGQGAGKRLLERAMGAREGCDRFLVHASDHPSAQGLYMQLGMLPLPYSVLFTGNPAVLPAPPGLAVERHAVSEILATLNAMDLGALGFTRAEDHLRWSAEGSYALVKQGKEMVAYFRVSAEGMIGPLVAVDERWMTAALDWAILKQQEISSEAHEIFVPGANRTAMAHLVKRGYRVRELNLLMSSQAMPGLARVIFHDMDFL